MAESDSDGEDYRRSEMGRSLGHREIVEILEEQEEGESDTTSNEEEEGEEEEDGEDDEDVNYIPVEDSPVRNEIGNTASISSRITSGQGGRDNKRRRLEEGEADASSPGCSASHGSEWSRSEIDGLFCPICMEPWTNDGDHHICCLPCGHIYGLSCIKRWLQQQKKNTAKCPQCNRRWTLKDVRKLFASRIVTVDEESQKRIQQLEATCAALERKDAGWKKKEFEWKNKKTESEKRIEKLQQKITQLQERTTYLERLLEEAPTRLTGSAVAEMGCQGHFSGSSIDLGFPTKQPSYIFEQKMELRMEGARVFDVSALYQILFVSRRLHGMVGRETLTKISLMYPREVEDIPLPSNTKAVKDLHISPANGDHVLFATLGKSLAVLSLESNNVVLTYNLPAAAWSCSWDFQRPYHIYAGLQNGTLMVFDMRQTSRPIESLNGLSFNPIHTIRSFSQNSTNGASSILTASSIGLCLWNIDCHEERYDMQILILLIML
ncbi:hypothetical protein SAY86_024747 [Trapa natans]|uniref:RING-type E3 ubiquitin transferase n=1 Tax=Trapa natans TaxID=22666 RepID=A0AAN7RDN1_TRANT|nr:hypothetical protein SAY86_024747 [Trapa natans]